MKTEYLKTLIALYDNNCDPSIHAKINLKRSALWKHIDLLEADLGFKLIDRKKQNNRFTKEALSFIPNAIKAYNILEGAKFSITESAKILSDKITLRICSTKSNGESWFSESIKDFNILFPNLSIEIYAEDAVKPNLIKQYDILVRPYEGSESFDKIWKVEYNLALFASEKYLETNGYPETPEDLLQHTIIAYGGSAFEGLSKEINWHLDAKKYNLPPLKPKIVINSTSAIYKMATLDMGICSTPSESLSIYNDSLVRVLPQIAGPTVYTHFMLNKNLSKNKVPVALRFADYFKNFLQSKKRVTIIEGD